MLVEFSNIIPLFLMADDESIDRIVFADLMSMTGGTALYSSVPLTLIPDSPGYYENHSLTMPYISNIAVRYRIYDSDGLTLIDVVEDVISLAVGGSGGSGGASGDLIEVTLFDDPTIEVIIDDNEISITIDMDEV